jgi:hypothetical protein
LPISRESALIICLIRRIEGARSALLLKRDGAEERKRRKPKEQNKTVRRSRRLIFEKRLEREPRLNPSN